MYVPQVKKIVPKATVTAAELDKPEPKFSVALSAVSPLQLTITKISLQLIKTLAEVFDWLLCGYHLNRLSMLLAVVKINFRSVCGAYKL